VLSHTQSSDNRSVEKRNVSEKNRSNSQKWLDRGVEIAGTFAA
jgi:hypothetical protein